MLSNITSPIMMSAVMLNVVMLNVVAPFHSDQCLYIRVHLRVVLSFTFWSKFFLITLAIFKNGIAYLYVT
jgi:hypothetical protein